MTQYMNSREYEKKIDDLAFEVCQLVLTYCQETLGHKSRDFNHCKSIIESEIKNPLINALDYYLHNND